MNISKELIDLHLYLELIMWNIPRLSIKKMYEIV